MSRTLETLVSRRFIEPVAPDALTARQELTESARHIRSARAIADSDPSGAFALGYDAMRKTISAHMRASGYRVTSGSGHHHRTGLYARAALTHADIAADVEAFDDLRQLRNQSEYEALMVEYDEVLELLGHAEALFEIVDGEVSA